MTKKELVSSVSKDTGVSQKVVNEVINSIFNCIYNDLSNLNSFVLPNIGTLKVKTLNERKIYSIMSGKVETLKPRYVCRFTVCPSLKETLKDIKVSKKK